MVRGYQAVVSAVDLWPVLVSKAALEARLPTRGNVTTSRWMEVIPPCPATKTSACSFRDGFLKFVQQMLHISTLTFIYKASPLKVPSTGIEQTSGKKIVCTWGGKYWPQRHSEHPTEQLSTRGYQELSYGPEQNRPPFWARITSSFSTVLQLPTIAVQGVKNKFQLPVLFSAVQIYECVTCQRPGVWEGRTVKARGWHEVRKSLLFMRMTLFSENYFYLIEMG